MSNATSQAVEAGRTTPGGTSTRDILAEEYRCPPGLVASEGEVPGEPGYFAFGPEVVTWGRLRGGSVRIRPEPPFHDAAPHAVSDGASLRLPFDPGEVVDNLRRERYAAAGRPHARNGGVGGVARRSYYLARDLLPVPVRRPLQRLYLRQRSGRLFPRWPLDATVDLLLERLLLLALERRGLDPVPFVWFWPDGARACLTMTHDVETARGRDACAALMDLDARFDLRASFQVVPEGRYAIPDSLVQEIRARGCELNLHDLNHDGRLFDEGDEFLRRATRINAHARELGARGFRSGSLYRNPDWYQSLEVDYDMSIPNVGHLDPQPGGCCTVRPYFIGDIVELPLTTTQDYTLFHLLGDYSIGLWQRQVDGILVRHGLASFNIHPDYVSERRARAAYSELLRWLLEVRDRTPLWVALPGEVERWWRARSRMRVVERADGWVVEGPEAERARVAWAVLEEGRVAYRVA